MTESQWLLSHDPTKLFRYLEMKGAGSLKLKKVTRWQQCERKLRLFLAACARRNWSLLKDQRSREAIEVGERFADGLADAVQLQTAYRAASDAWVTEAYSSAAKQHFNIAAAWAAAKVAQASEKMGFSSFRGNTHLSIVATATSDGESGAQQHIDEKQIMALEGAIHAAFVRDLFGNPFRPVRLEASWLTSSVVGLAGEIDEFRGFDRMPILADALQDAGCENAVVLNHCRQEETHVRGCWVLDLLMGNPDGLILQKPA